MCGQFLKVITLFVGFYYVSCHELDCHPNWIYLPTEDCGYGATADRIVGGNEAKLGQFPWIARIGYKMKPKKPQLFLCAGSIINKWYIVTAVHCAIGLLGDTIYSIRLGDNFIKEKRDCEDGVCAPPVQNIGIAEVIKYEYYVGSKSVSYGDLALIKLARPAIYHDYVQPICLPRDGIINKLSDYLSPGKSVEVAGWGTTNSISGDTPSKLMVVSLPVVDLSVCRDNYKGNLIDETELCVGMGQGKDSCVGDSGGPLMGAASLHSEPRYFLFGIVSYGMKWCGIGAAVYTNVTSYLPWILDHINK